MPTLSFQFDWLEAENVRGPELSATWAALQIRAGDTPLTRVLDVRAKTVRDFIYVPLYPLAEWLATNWWFLNHEFGSPTKERTGGFKRRHSLASNRDGYAFPALEIIPSGSRTQLSWKREALQWSRVEFLNGGVIGLDSADFRESCGDFIDQVVRRLAALDIERTLLQEEWEAIQTTDEEEAKFCIAAASLGWHPYALSEMEQSEVFFYDEKLVNLLDEALPALSPENLHENRQTVQCITRAIEEAQQSHSVPLERFRFFTGDSPISKLTTLNSWDAGYELARWLRRGLNLENAPLPTLKHLASAFEEEDELLEQAIRPIDFLPAVSLVDGVVTRTHDDKPAFGLRQLREDQRRFHFCRALAEALIYPGSDALITRANSERQQCNRAFAAEFLAPASGLKEKITCQVVDDDTIEELATDFGVSPRVIEHQIVNHRIATVSL